MRNWVGAVLMWAAVGVGPAHAQRAFVEGAGGVWAVEGTGRTGDVKVAPFLGREALWLRNGTQAVRTDFNFSDGAIAFDLAPMEHGDFTAIVFRRADFQNHENVYLRLGRSGELMALQYAPRINGSSTWQLYPEFTAAVAWPRNQWTNVRAEFRGSMLQIFVGDTDKPALTVPRLRHDSSKGEVAFWARVNDKPEEWAAAISNLRITPTPGSAARSAAGAVPAGYISGWEVAGPFAADESAGAAAPPNAKWKTVQAEESGLVNLNRLFRVQPNTRQAAYARVSVVAPSARLMPLHIGYSDDVKVFLNGEPLYSGVNGFNSRAPVFASFVDARFETLWLPLKAGPNELVLVVSDDQRFGWGFAARLER